MALCCCRADDDDTAEKSSSGDAFAAPSLRRCSPPAPVSQRPPEVAVRLNVYSLISQNKKLHRIGLGVYHTGVVVYGIEWGYGESSEAQSGSGLFGVFPGQAAGTLFRTVFLGVTTLSPEQVDTILHRLENEWRSADYHILNHNCNHFSKRFCDLLSSVQKLRIPKWCNRVAHMANKIVPRKLASYVHRLIDEEPPKAPAPNPSQRVHEMPDSVIPSNWYLHPSIAQSPRYTSQKPRANDSPLDLSVSLALGSTACDDAFSTSDGDESDTTKSVCCASAAPERNEETLPLQKQQQEQKSLRNMTPCNSQQTSDAEVNDVVFLRESPSPTSNEETVNKECLKSPLSADVEGLDLQTVTNIQQDGEYTALDTENDVSKSYTKENLEDVAVKKNQFDADIKSEGIAEDVNCLGKNSDSLSRQEMPEYGVSSRNSIGAEPFPRKPSSPLLTGIVVTEKTEIFSVSSAENVNAFGSQREQTANTQVVQEEIAPHDDKQQLSLRDKTPAACTPEEWFLECSPARAPSQLSSMLPSNILRENTEQQRRISNTENSSVLLDISTPLPPLHETFASCAEETRNEVEARDLVGEASVFMDLYHAAVLADEENVVELHTSCASKVSTAASISAMLEEDASTSTVSESAFSVPKPERRLAETSNQMNQQLNVSRRRAASI